MHSYHDLLDLSDSELAQIDPLVQNLLVAKSLPALADREIEPLQRQVDRWADHFRRWLPQAEREYHNRPERWGKNVHLFRLGMLCQFLVQNVKIAYKESLRELKKVAYTDANDLFLTGIIDTRRGTCGTMAELYLAMGWRMGWPVTLTKIWWHTMLRYDDGVTVLNLEVTEADRGGFACLSDDELIERDKIDLTHIASGSDLCTLTPRQVLGIFIGSRGRHMWDTVQVTRARKDFELALTLYPQSRVYRHMVEECRLVEGGGWKVIQGMEPPTPEQQRMDKMLDSNRVTFGLGFSAQKMRDDFEQTLALLSLPAQEARGFKSGQSNLYDFVGNGPTDGTDPSGLAGRVETDSSHENGGDWESFTYRMERRELFEGKMVDVVSLQYHTGYLTTQRGNSRVVTGLKGEWYRINNSDDTVSFRTKTGLWLTCHDSGEVTIQAEPGIGGALTEWQKFTWVKGKQADTWAINCVANKQSISAIPYHTTRTLVINYQNADTSLSYNPYNDTVRQEVDKIFQNAVDRYAPVGSQLKIEWKGCEDVSSVETGRSNNDETLSVTVQVIPAPWQAPKAWGYTSGRGAGIVSQNIEVSGFAARADLGHGVVLDPDKPNSLQHAQVYAAVIAHEIGYHAIGRFWGHTHDTDQNYIDAAGTGHPGAFFSPIAARFVCSKLGFEVIHRVQEGY